MLQPRRNVNEDPVSAALLVLLPRPDGRGFGGARCRRANQEASQDIACNRPRSGQRQSHGGVDHRQLYQYQFRYLGGADLPGQRAGRGARRGRGHATRRRRNHTHRRHRDPQQFQQAQPNKLALSVFNRFVLGLPLSWSEEFQKFGHIWMVMIAVPVAYRRGAHLGMDMLLRLLPAVTQRLVGLLTEVLWLALALAIGRYTLAIMQVAQSQESPGLGLPMHWVYSGMVIGSAYLAFVALRRFATYFGWSEPPPDSLLGNH